MEEVKITLRLPVNVHRQLSELAASERRSLNAQIVTMLEKALG